MASLRRIPGRKVWIACYTDGEGRRRQRSTKTRNRDKAMKIAQAYEDVARKEQTFSSIMVTIADIMEIGEEVPAYTLRDYVTQFLKRKKPTVGKSTYSNAERAYRVFVEGMGEKADKPMLTLTPADLHRWREVELERISPNTLQTYTKIVRIISSSLPKRRRQNRQPRCRFGSVALKYNLMINGLCPGRWGGPRAGCYPVKKYS